MPHVLDRFPRLKISFEHLSSAEGVDFIEKNGRVGKLAATVTPHHLLYDRRHAFSGGFRALLNCKPLVNTANDRQRLRGLVQKGLPFVSAGTDTAPHAESKKFSSCCAYGVFNAPATIELYTQIFDDLGAINSLEAFLSINGPRFYGLESDTKTVTLVKREWRITEPIVTDEGVNIWPICHTKHGLGNETIQWDIQRKR